MSKKSLLITFSLILIVSIPMGLYQVVRASPSPNIMMSYAYCPSEVYVSEPVAPQVNITNLDSKPHNYTIIWSASWFLNRGYKLYSYGTINPGDEIAITQLFITPLDATYFFINATLFEDNQTPVNVTGWMVTTLSVAFTLTHSIDTCPIYPGHAFNVNVTATNVGNAGASNVVLRIKRPRDWKLELLSEAACKLGNIEEGKSNATLIHFNTTADTKPGIYLISFILDYDDNRQVSSRQTYGVYIEISSVGQEIEYLDHMVEILKADTTSLRNEIQRQWLTTFYTLIALSAVIIFTSALTFYFLLKLRGLKTRR